MINKNKYGESGSVAVNPHNFKPLKKWFNRGRCCHCFVPEHDHPVADWVDARPYGDNSFQSDKPWPTEKKIKLRSNEISADAIIRSKGKFIIELSDEEAKKILPFFEGKDARSPS